MKKWFYISVLVLFASCNGKGGTKGSDGPDTTNQGPKSISYSVINTYPHDTSSFTQGLIIYNGNLYEGTGELGRSKLMKVDLKSGKIETQIPLDKKYFGEGITILHDTVYQLTWQNKIVFSYSLNNFKKIAEFPINTEGWGITNDGKQLIVSDGSSDLFFYEPSTFRLLKTQTVIEAGSPSFNLNELEYINGYVYANQWQAPYIFKIDPANGQILAKIDLTTIWDRVRKIDPNADVPNGIAFDTATKKMYVTGKLWPELYEIQLGE